MHIITDPSTGEGRNVTFETNASSLASTNDNNNTTTISNPPVHHGKLPWYMGQWTTPVTAVLEAYVLISFLVFFIMFMLCVHRHGCCHILHRRRRSRQRAVGYQQQMRVRAWEEEDINRMRDGDVEIQDVDGIEVNSIDTEHDGRVQEIQRLERALRTAGIA